MEQMQEQLDNERSQLESQLEEVKKENKELKEDKIQRLELTMKERQSLEESMIYWRNQTKELEKRLEDKGQKKTDEEHKELTFNYTTLSQPGLELSSYDSAAERASYLPIAWDGANRTQSVETALGAQDTNQGPPVKPHLE